MAVVLINDVSIAHVPLHNLLVGASSKKLVLQGKFVEGIQGIEHLMDQMKLTHIESACACTQTTRQLLPTHLFGLVRMELDTVRNFLVGKAADYALKHNRHQLGDCGSLKPQQRHFDATTCIQN